MKMAWVGLVVMGGGAVVMALSGVEMVDADQHAIFQYRMPVAAALIAGYLLVDYLLARRRARSAVGAASVTMTSQVQPKRGFAAELMALVFVAGGAAAFWHEHITHDIPNPVAVVGKFVSAACVDRTYKRIGPSIGPHMSIGYEFVSRSTSVRTSGMKCLLDNCEAEKKPPEYMDTEYKRVFYASLSLCQAALANVLELKAPTTLWTGDKDPNSAVRARFTSERDPPSYFLLWVPLLVAALVLLVSGFLRIRHR
ncbi:MAG: hypothetical protein IPN53_21735 [Comamonadaceae bacterium]|nr:hypothetical protein [Comamonadaceae bacterium]